MAYTVSACQTYTCHKYLTILKGVVTFATQKTLHAAQHTLLLAASFGVGAASTLVYP